MKKYAGMINLKTLFVTVQIVLYVCFLTLDFTDSNISLSTKIKFTVIILCFCYVLFTNGHNRSIFIKTRSAGLANIMTAALFFTLISDLFILILDKYLYGVLTFIIVQQLYNFRISLKINQEKSGFKYKNAGETYIIWLAAQILVAFAVSYLLRFLGVELNMLLIASTFYFICILTNTIRADIAACRTLFAAGMSLFLLCDINVGLFNLSGFIYMPNEIYTVIYSLSSILMWLFYAPSQVLLALSVSEQKN